MKRAQKFLSLLLMCALIFQAAPAQAFLLDNPAQSATTQSFLSQRIESEALQPRLVQGFTSIRKVASAIRKLEGMSLLPDLAPAGPSAQPKQRFRVFFNESQGGSSGLSIPPHWDSRWDMPTAQEVAAAKHILDNLFIMSVDERLDERFYDLSRGSGMNNSRMLSAMYYIDPTATAALVSAFGTGYHLGLRVLFTPLLEKPTVESSIGTALLRDALSYFRIAPGASSLKAMQSETIVVNGKPVSFTPDLEGVSGVFGYLDPAVADQLLMALNDRAVARVWQGLHWILSWKENLSDRLRQSSKRVLDKALFTRQEGIASYIPEHERDAFQRMYRSPIVSGIASPAHWDVSWPKPTHQDFQDAEALLHQLGSASTDTAEENALVEQLSQSSSNPIGVLRAIYYLQPDLAGALFAGLGERVHYPLAELLKRVSTSLGANQTDFQMEPELLGDIMNRGLKIYVESRLKDSGSGAAKILLEGKIFEIRMNLLQGMAGLFGFLPPLMSDRAISRIESQNLPHIVQAMLKKASSAHPSESRAAQTRIKELLARLPADRATVVVNLLSPTDARLLEFVRDQGTRGSEPSSMRPMNLFSFGGSSRADGDFSDVDELGNKGANLAGMTNLGLRVPPGFTVPDFQTERLIGQKDIPADLLLLIENYLELLEIKAAKDTGAPLFFGNPEQPLIVSVRGGAAKSNPGAYPTFNKVGLHQTTLKAYATRLGNPYQARMDYLRFIHEYFFEVEKHREGYLELVTIFQENPFYRSYEDRDYRALSLHGTIEDLDQLIDKANATYQKFAGRPFPEPRQQLIETILAIANVYDPNMRGKAISVQYHVLGDKDDGKSFSGVVFSRNPFNGVRELVGSYAFATAGRDIMSYYEFDPILEELRRNNREMRYAEISARMPAVYKQLERGTAAWDLQFRSSGDFEVAAESGRLYFVQARDNFDAMTPLAQVRMMVDLAHEGSIGEAEALTRVSLDDLLWLRASMEQPTVRESLHSQAIAEGTPLFPGIAQARLVIGRSSTSDDSDPAIYLVNKPRQAQNILTEHVESSHGRVAGILATFGGYASHPLIVLRKSNHRVPFVTLSGVRFENNHITLGQTVLHDGDSILLDGNTGRIYGKLGADALQDSEIERVKRGEINESQSPLWPLYEIVQRWIAIKQEELDKETKTPPFFAMAIGGVGFGHLSWPVGLLLGSTLIASYLYRYREAHPRFFADLFAKWRGIQPFSRLILASA